MFGDCPGDPHEVRHCSDPLGDDGRERRCADPEVETEDQHDLDDEVEHGGSDRNIERPFGVLEAAEIADPGEGQQHCREAEERDPEIDLRIDGGFALSAHQLDQWVPAEVADAGDDNTDNEGKPQALHRLVSGLPVLAGAQQTGDRRGGAVGEEDENGEGDQQERRRQRKSGELRGAEVPDHGGVGEDVQRLGDQRAERGQGQGEDPPIGLTPPDARRQPPH